MGEGVNSMDNTIGSSLTRGMDLAVQRIIVQAGSHVGVTSNDASFAAVMQAQVTARLAEHGITLPTVPTEDDAAAELPTSDSADDVWERVQLEQSAHYGQGDAIMAALQQAADERWERYDRDGGRGFDLSEFL
jgi:hypothetical protein